MGGRSTGGADIRVHGKTRAADGAGAFGRRQRSRRGRVGCRGHRRGELQQTLQQLAGFRQRERSQRTLLAAHIQPNAAVVAELMIDVSDRLRAETGNSSIDGYQTENPDRVDAIVRAVFDAVKARDIRYAEPPASWGDIGQKIRTPTEVLTGRLPTAHGATTAQEIARGVLEETPTRPSRLSAREGREDTAEMAPHRDTPPLASD